jgi:UPF0755 protein
MKFKPLRKIFLFPIIIVLFFGIIVVSGIFWFRENSKPVSSVYSKQAFVIIKGMTAGQVGQKLYELKLIRSTLAFKIYVQLFDKAKRINTGEFSLSPSMGLTDIVEVLGKGPEELWVTIPEGLRKEEIVEKVISSLEIYDLRSPVFRKDFLDLVREKEGYLFPDTYLFPRDATPQLVVTKLLSTFDERIDEKIKDDISKSGRNLSDIVIMASLIERETKTGEERLIVAGILWKRLNANWPLQVDASVQYAVANVNCPTSNIKCSNWWPILTKDDLEIKSPFNSYKYTSLPPSPISNPGTSSIEAASHPQDSDYWFYIHSPDGEIHYAKTIEEHNLNIKKYLGK